MLFNSNDLQSAAGYSDKRYFLKDCRRYDFPITAHRKVMGQNRYKIIDFALALIVGELEQYELPTPVIKKLLDRLNLNYIEDQIDKLQIGEIPDLIICIPARTDLDLTDFPTAASDWDEVANFATEENVNFFPIPIGELLLSKIKGAW